MKEILELIETKKQEFSKLSFFDFLGDEKIDVMTRIAWATYMVFFALSFKDINNYAIYREDSSNNPIQELLNQHTYEDSRHWRWYLEDITKLGLDKQFSGFTDTIMFLWGEETKKTRCLSYNLFAILLLETDPVVKLAIVEAIEATGNVAWDFLGPLGNELERKTGQRYHYFSQSHAYVEVGHIIGSGSFEETEKFLQNIQLNEEQKIRACQRVEIVFKSFTDFINEMMNIIEKKIFAGVGN